MPPSSTTAATPVGTRRLRLTVRRLPDQLTRVLEEMSDGIITVEEEGRIFFANPRLETLSGYARHELLGMLIEVLVPPDRRHTHRLQRSGYHQTGAPPRPMGTGLDIRFRRKDGSEFPVGVALSPVETATGRVVIAAVRDVSDRKVGRTARSRERLERELHEGAQQALFGAGLNLQTAPALAADSGLRQRLESAINQIEEVIRDLRNYILGLRPGILADPPNQR